VECGEDGIVLVDEILLIHGWRLVRSRDGLGLEGRVVVGYQKPYLAGSIYNRGLGGRRESSKEDQARKTRRRE
jgi:hypothetical protein